MQIGSAVTFRGEDWKVIDIIPAAGGGQCVGLECLDRPAFATRAIGDCEPIALTSGEIAARIAAREGRRDRKKGKIRVTRKQIARAIHAKNEARAEFLRGELAKLEGGAA